MLRLLKNLAMGAASVPWYLAGDGSLGVVELDDNLADAERPPEVPPGVYEAEVQDVQTATSGKGNEYYAIRIVIPQENLPKDVQQHYDDGAVLSWNRQVVPKKGDRRALYNLRKLVEAMGLDSNTTTIDPNEWMGCRVRARIVHRKFEGEDRAEVRSLDPVDAPVAARGGNSRAEPEQEEEETKPRGRQPARRGRR